MERGIEEDNIPVNSAMIIQGGPAKLGQVPPKMRPGPAKLGQFFNIGVLRGDYSLNRIKIIILPQNHIKYEFKL